MPLDAMICLDKPDAGDLRAETRAAHLAYVAETGVVVQAGPLLDDDERMIGSLIILDVEDREAATRWVGSDPDFLAGLFDSVTLHRWKKVVG